MDNPRCLHLVGPAAGVSTTADILRGVKIHREVRIHEVLFDYARLFGSAFQSGKFCGYTVYDTPGLDKTDSKSCERYLTGVLNSVYENGGIVAFIHPQERMSVQMRRVVQTLSIALGRAFSVSCILITVDMAYTDVGQQAESRCYDQLAAHQQDLERNLRVQFRRCYGYTTAAQKTRQIFIDRLTKDLSMVESVNPGVVLSMAAVDQILNDPGAMARCLRSVVERLENDLRRAEESLAFYERSFHELNSAIGHLGAHALASPRNLLEPVLHSYRCTTNELMRVRSELRALPVDISSMEMERWARD